MYLTLLLNTYQAESFRSPSYDEDFSSPSVSSPLRRRNTSILVPSPRISFASSFHAELVNNATHNFRKDGEEHAFSGLRCVNDVSSPPELGKSLFIITGQADYFSQDAWDATAHFSSQ